MLALCSGQFSAMGESSGQKTSQFLAMMTSGRSFCFFGLNSFLTQSEESFSLFVCFFFFKET